jgi:hypothetical protein
MVLLVVNHQYNVKKKIQTVLSLPQEVSDFSAISKANNGQFLWQGAYIKK